MEIDSFIGKLKCFWLTWVLNDAGILLSLPEENWGLVNLKHLKGMFCGGETPWLIWKVSIIDKVLCMERGDRVLTGFDW